MLVSSIPLSLLDLAIIGPGQTPRDAFASSVAMAQRAEALRHFEIPIAVPIQHGFLGYTVLQYITKAKAGMRRPTRAYESILQLIPQEIQTNLMPFAVPHISELDAALGDVPHLYSIVPLAQSNNAPIHGLTTADGLVGAQSNQALGYGSIIGEVAKRLLRNIAGVGNV